MIREPIRALAGLRESHGQCGTPSGDNSRHCGDRITTDVK
jgi:hypothetical protein